MKVNYIVIVISTVRSLLAALNNTNQGKPWDEASIEVPMGVDNIVQCDSDDNISTGKTFVIESHVRFLLKYLSIFLVKNIATFWWFQFNL